MTRLSSMRSGICVRLYKFAYSYDKVVSTGPNIFNSLILKIQINHLGGFHNFDLLSFKHSLNLTDKILLSLRNFIVKTGQIRCCREFDNKDVRNENISKFRFDAKFLCFGLVSFCFQLTFVVKNFLSFRNPSNFVSLCVQNQTMKGRTHPA